MLRDEPITVIKPAKGWTSLNLREVWDYRELLWFITLRNIKAHYRQMALGPLWIILKPIVSMLLFTFIFGGLAKLPSDALPYPLFAYSGLLPWGYFAGAVTGATGSLNAYIGMISKVYFPRLTVTISAVLSGVVDLCVSFLVLLVLMLIYGYLPSWTIIALPLYVLLAALTAFSIGVWSAALAVRYRDLMFFINFLIQFWMYVTPVAYASSAIPDRWQLLYKLNPMYWVVEGFRWALFGTGTPFELLALIPIGIVILLLISGLFVFRRTELTVVDLL